MGLIGIEMLGRDRAPRIAVGHEDGIGPVEEVPGSGTRHGPAPSDGVPAVEDVKLLRLRPEHHVLGVEVVPQLPGDDRFVPDQLPTNAVGGHVAEQFSLGFHVGLVTLRRRHARAAVDEGAELVSRVQDHVVLPAPLGLEQTEGRTGPTNPVPALGIAGVGLGPEAAAVVHAVGIAVLEDGGVEGVPVLPGPLVGDGDASGPGNVQFQAGSPELSDQMVVDEELPPGTDVQRRFETGLPPSGSRRGRRQQCRRPQNQQSQPHDRTSISESVAALPPCPRIT